MSQDIKAGRLARLRCRGLIGIQPTAGEALRQEDRLAECEAETFAGNRIHAAGGIADEGGSPAIYLPQFSRCRDCSSFRRSPLQSCEAGGNGRKLCERRVKPQVRVPRDGGYADFVGRYRRDIKLAVASPMKFHAVRPRGNAIVTAERETLLVMNIFDEALPTGAPGNERRPLRQSSASAPDLSPAIHHPDAVR